MGVRVCLDVDALRHGSSRSASIGCEIPDMACAQASIDEDEGITMFLVSWPVT